MSEKTEIILGILVIIALIWFCLGIAEEINTQKAIYEENQLDIRQAY